MKRYAGASEFWPRNCLAPRVLREMWLISNKSNDVSSSCSPSTGQTREDANGQLLGKRRRADQFFPHYEIPIVNIKEQ